MLIKLTFAILALAGSILIPFYFDTLVLKAVAGFGIGWTASTILIRLMVILLFALFLKLIFASVEKLKNVRTWVILLIALLPGFGISFIAPIYITDYGMLTDELTLDNPEILEQTLLADIVNENGYSFIAFFTTTCPHCKAASEKIGTNLEAGQSTPVTAIFPGEEENTKAFLENHHGENFNYFLLDNDPLFIDLSGGIFPSMFLLDKNGKTVCHWTGDQLNYTGLDYLRSLEQ